MNFIIENFDFSNQFFIIAAAHLFAVISPGPDFIVVIKQSVKRGRKSAILTSIDIRFIFYLAFINATVVSSIRFENPHSLSYQATTLTRLPLITFVNSASYTDDAGL